MGAPKRLKRWTKAEFARRWQWFKGRFKIQDWNVDLVIQNEPFVEDTGDTEVGNMSGCRFAKTAWVWVSPKRCRSFAIDPGLTFFHELLHVACEDVGFERHREEDGDFFVDKMAEVCEEAYLTDERRKKRRKKQCPAV